MTNRPESVSLKLPTCFGFIDRSEFAILAHDNAVVNTDAPNE
jgi:hypothetical protein